MDTVVGRQLRGESERSLFWRGHVEAHRKRGGSVRGYCRAQGLSEPSFYAWRKRLFGSARGLADKADGGIAPDASGVVALRGASSGRGSGKRRGQGKRNEADESPLFAEVGLDLVEAARVNAMDASWSNGASGVEIVLGNGLVARVRRGFDAATLRRVASALEADARC